MKVAITGSHGFIGSALVDLLQRDGVDVLALRRGEHWDPDAGTVVPGVLNGVDAVVHLAGEGIANKRWTDAQKRTILESRTKGTTAIARACAADGVPTLLSGSAVGFYGDTGARVTDESAPTGHDFLADVCRQWEAATAAASDAGARVVHLRTGIVQSKAGGQLGRQLLLFKLGLGGRLGSGRQWFSWITRTDYVRAVRFCLDTDALRGPVNMTAPEPVTNAEYTQATAKAVHRPALLPVPTAALKVLLGGELVDSLVVSQRVVPKALLDAGFVFEFPTVVEGMAHAVRN